MYSSEEAACSRASHLLTSDLSAWSPETSRTSEWRFQAVKTRRSRSAGSNLHIHRLTTRRMRFLHHLRLQEDVLDLLVPVDGKGMRMILQGNPQRVDDALALLRRRPQSETPALRLSRLLGRLHGAATLPRDCFRHHPSSLFPREPRSRSRHLHRLLQRPVQLLREFDSSPTLRRMVSRQGWLCSVPKRPPAEPKRPVKLRMHRKRLRGLRTRLKGDFSQRPVVPVFQGDVRMSPRLWKLSTTIFNPQHPSTTPFTPPRESAHVKKSLDSRIRTPISPLQTLDVTSAPLLLIDFTCFVCDVSPTVLVMQHISCLVSSLRISMLPLFPLFFRLMYLPG